MSVIIGQLNVTRDGHTYAVLKLRHWGKGIAYLATRDGGRIKSFYSKRELAKHYPTIRKEINIRL